MLKIMKNMQASQVLFDRKQFSKNSVVIHEIILVLTLDRPIYVGFTILDLSKYFVPGIDYDYAKKA